MARTYNNFSSYVSVSRGSNASYRSSNGYFVSASANTPRVEYSKNEVLLGFLAEPQRTNLVTYSDDLTNWTEIRTTTSYGLVESPFVGYSATEITETDDTSTYYFVDTYYQYADTSQTHCISAYVKAGIRDRLWLYLYDDIYANNIKVNVDLGEETITAFSSGTGVVLDYRLEPDLNGWYRVWMSGTTGTSNRFYSVRIYTADANGTINHDGDSSSPALYVCGVQLERGSYPSSLIHTNGASATRPADDVLLNIPDFKYEGLEGTVYFEANVISYSDETDPVLLSLEQDNVSILSLSLTSEGENPYIYADGDISDNSYNRIAVSYRSNSAIGGLALNGISNAYSANLSFSSATTTFRLNSNAYSDTATIAHYKNIKYFPRALSLEYVRELTE